MPSRAATGYTAGSAQRRLESGETPSRLAKFDRANQMITKSAMVARPGAIGPPPQVLAAGGAGEEPITATEVAAISTSTPKPPVVPTQKNSWTTGSQPLIAYSRMTTSPITLCTSEAASGAPVRGRGPPEHRRQHPLPAQREHVAGRGVVERDHRGEHAGQEQHLPDGDCRRVARRPA